MTGRAGFALVVAAAMSLGGCARMLAVAVPSHDQTLDLPEIPSGRYQIYKAHAAIHFKVDHMGYSIFVARFDDFDAAFDFDNQAPEASRLEVTIRAASVNSGDAEMDELMRGHEFFNAGKYPEIRFVSETLEIIDPEHGTLRGRLSFHGVTRPQALDVRFRGGARNFLTEKYTLGFSATGRLIRSDFNMGGYVPLVGDEVTIEIEAEFELEE